MNPTPLIVAALVAATQIPVQLPTDDPYVPDAKLQPSLSMSVAPKSDPVKPFRFTLTGFLQTNGVDEALSCNGRVMLRVRKSNPTVAKGRVNIQPDCTFTKTLTLDLTHLGAKGRVSGGLRVTARFGGNEYLQPDSAPTRKATYGMAVSQPAPAR